MHAEEQHLVRSKSRMKIGVTKTQAKKEDSTENTNQSNSKLTKSEIEQIEEGRTILRTFSKLIIETIRNPCSRIDK